MSIEPEFGYHIAYQISVPNECRSSPCSDKTIKFDMIWFFILDIEDFQYDFSDQGVFRNFQWSYDELLTDKLLVMKQY